MSILKKIVEQRRMDISEWKSRHSVPDLRRLAESGEPPAPFLPAVASPGVNIIAEVKRASPSAGVLREPFDPVEIAKAYKAGGAKAISVLTESRFFRGSPEHLQQVALAVELPVLMKDFVVDEVQVYHAKVLGASSFLLIASILPKSALADFIALGRELGMEPLVEVHSLQEAEKAVLAGALIVGVNNRNLETFEVSLNTTLEILPFLKGEGRLVVSESGIKSRQDIETLKSAGADAFLIGSALVRSENPQALLSRWLRLP
jgi:indole-3-glycerol phosphate synthase